MLISFSFPGASLKIGWQSDGSGMDPETVMIEALNMLTGQSYPVAENVPFSRLEYEWPVNVPEGEAFFVRIGKVLVKKCNVLRKVKLVLFPIS